MNRTPRVVKTILEMPGLWFLARLALVSAFLVSGITKLFDFSGAVAEHAAVGLPMPAVWAVLTIVAQLGGSLLILSGRLVWLGAGALGVFTGIAALLVNAFWTMPAGQSRFIAMNAFFEHGGLIGGLMLVAILAHREPRE
jgi:uncharacterized membrane protein YphA (DoxX/SURF4 family)